MKSLPILESHYGQKTWTQKELDESRRENCLCHSCAWFTPDHPHTNCAYAQTLFDLCVTAGMAMGVSRCASYLNEALAQ